eukprot:9645414-Karenia_brevis.AAC.1
MTDYGVGGIFAYYDFGLQRFAWAKARSLAQRNKSAHETAEYCPPGAENAGKESSYYTRAKPQS